MYEGVDRLHCDKSISEAGGLKSIRKRYVPWSVKKTRDHEVGISNNNHEREVDRFMALFASESADPGSTGIDMSLE